MRLRVVDAELRFECGSCAMCCKQPWLAEVEPEKLDAIRSFDWVAKYPHLTGKQLLMDAEVDGARRVVLGKQEQGHCVFLDKDDLCIVHKELGYDAKPEICRRFPYFPAYMPDADHISANFACPAVQAGKGPTLEENREQVLSVNPTRQDPPGRSTDVALLLGHLIPCDAAHALADRWAERFLPAPGRDAWERFAECVQIVTAAARTDRESLCDALKRPDFGGDVSAPPLGAPESLRSTPIQARSLLAFNLWNDYYPPDHYGTQHPSLGTRFGLIGKVLNVARMSGAHASRYMPGNIALHKLDTPQMRLALIPEESSHLLCRWIRARFRQRTFRRDRVSMVAGLHQQMVDFNTVMFYARALANRDGLLRPHAGHYTGALRIVEFGISYQKRAFDKVFHKRIMSMLESFPAICASLNMFCPRQPAMSGHGDDQLVQAGA